MADWQGKVALVTGGSQGLGFAIARAFARQHARIVIAARDSAALTSAQQQLMKNGTEVLAITADVTRQEDVDALVNETLARFGRLDVLVNNVGYSSRGRVLSTTPEDFEHSLKLNLISTVRCTRAAAPHLTTSRGHLVNIGSLAGKSAARYLGAYPAAKFALTAYTQQLRLELEPEIHVLLVCPGPIARDEPRARAADLAADVPDSARKPGGGVKTNSIDPDQLAEAIVRACEKRKPEIVWPAKARLLFALTQLSPKLGDWLVRRSTG